MNTEVSVVDDLYSNTTQSTINGMRIWDKESDRARAPLLDLAGARRPVRRT
eukprot:COSAG02_NODE_2997_length_7580_cov_8.348750_1_plen_50_part_10